MEPAGYNAFADMLAKFQSSPEWIKAVWLLAPCIAVVGVAWLAAQVLREAIRAFAGRRAGGGPADLDLIALAEARRIAGPEGDFLLLRLPAPAQSLPPPQPGGFHDDGERR